jgi:uroporphyrinogen-III synthase
MKVVLTATEGLTVPLAEALEAEGFEVEARPLVAIEPLPGPPLRADEYDWVVLTSRNAVDALFARLDGGLPKVAAVGRGTAEALRERDVEPDFVARVSTQEGVADELPRPPGRVLFPAAEGARGVLVQELGADFVPVYRTVELAPELFPAADLVVLASASAARAFAALGVDAACVSIGPVTSAEARGLGLRVVAEAAGHDREGLVAAVKLAASNAGSSPS